MKIVRGRLGNMGSVGSTAQALLCHIVNETNTKKVWCTAQKDSIILKFLHHDESYQVIEIQRCAIKTTEDPIFKAAFAKVRKCADTIQFDQLAWAVGTTR